MEDDYLVLRGCPTDTHTHRQMVSSQLGQALIRGTEKRRGIPPEIATSIMFDYANILSHFTRELEADLRVSDLSCEAF